VSKNYQHQCMLVELLAPNGGVNFVQQSSWNNMNFDQMSIVAREALIDARQLPIASGQKDQDIYLVAMPRNMPAGIQGPSQDGGTFIRERALVRAETIARPYIQDIGQLNQDQIYEIAARYNRQAPPPLPKPHADPETQARVKKVHAALMIMPVPEFNAVYGMLKIVVSPLKPAELTEATVREIGPAEAAGIVPTLEIYPFYHQVGAGNMYMPMSSFSVFLSHAGTMSGMAWAIDGATQVGKNIFHLRIPAKKAKKIQVRAQAIEKEGKLAPGNPRWPCSGGCPGCGGKSCGLVPQTTSVLPGLLAGLYVVLRRRRRRPAPTPTPLP
jgi:hypothetical protein